MAENKYKLEEFDAKKLAATNTHWNKVLDANPELLFPGDTRRILDWASKSMIYDDHQPSSAYGIFRGAEKTASAIIEIIYHRKGTSSTWLKMVDVTISPDIEVAILKDDIKGFEAVFDVFAEAVVGTLRLTGKRKANTVKLYGRNEALMHYLKTLAAEFNSGVLKDRVKHLSVAIEGRWLVFKVKGAKK